MTPALHLTLGALGLGAFVWSILWAIRPLKEAARVARDRRSRDSLHALGQPLGSSMEDIQYKLFGALYGFPSCCVNEFCTSYCMDTRNQYPDGPWMGTGYMPCISCAPTAAQDFDKFVAEHIATKRICPLPFPSELSRTATDAALSFVAEMEIDAINAAKPRLRGQPAYAHAYQA